MGVMLVGECERCHRTGPVRGGFCGRCYLAPPGELERLNGMLDELKAQALREPGTWPRVRPYAFTNNEIRELAGLGPQPDMGKCRQPGCLDPDLRGGLDGFCCTHQAAAEIEVAKRVAALARDMATPRVIIRTELEAKHPRTAPTMARAAALGPCGHCDAMGHWSESCPNRKPPPQPAPFEQLEALPRSAGATWGEAARLAPPTRVRAVWRFLQAFWRRALGVARARPVPDYTRRW